MTKLKRSTRETDAKLASLTVALDEVSRLAATQVSRWNNLRQNATLLVGASGLTGGLSANQFDTPLQLIPIAALLLAALMGILSLGGLGQVAVDPQAVATGASELDVIQLKTTLIDAIVEAHRQDEVTISQRSKRVRLGFVLLIIGVAGSLAVANLASHAQPEPTRVILEGSAT